MSNTAPNSPNTTQTTSSAHSTPCPAPRTPIYLGLSDYTTGNAPISQQRNQAPSLSIRTANGSRVSILNDCDYEPNSIIDHKRCSSVPGISRGVPPPPSSSSSSSINSTGPFRAQSTPGITPQQAPAMLPSLTTLVQAVGLITSTESNTQHHEQIRNTSVSAQGSSESGTSATSSNIVSVSPSSSIPVRISEADTAPAATKTTAKRKYKCNYKGCGKAFTTSGHLARHQRIHTGEKNFPCLFPGCTSRFSRQDNMMQHYRTHLSSKSRRNCSPRKVVFLDPAVVDPYHGPGSVYNGAPVYHTGVPVHHPHHAIHPGSHRRHHPYAHAHTHPAGMQMNMAASQQSVPEANKQILQAQYNAPPVHMVSGRSGAPVPMSASPHNYRPTTMAKHSPSSAHAGAMAFY